MGSIRATRKLHEIALSATLLAAVGLVLPAAADYDAGVTAFEAGDFSVAFTEWRAAASSGDARAQFAIGNFFIGGDGVPQDFSAAIRWFEQAAEQGHDGAQYILGLIFDQGWTGLR